MHRLIIFLLVSGCGWLPKNNHPRPNVDPHLQVKEKYDFYLTESFRSADAYGFVGGHCDSLLFTSLAVHSGLTADVFKAEKSPGLWERHPAFDCYPGGGSDSTISKDMFTGLLIYLAGTKNSAAAGRVIAYGKANNYVMGSAKDTATLVSKTILSAGLISDFKYLSGLSLAPPQSDDAGGVKNGFLGHLDVLRIYTSYLLYGGISSSQLATTKAYCQHSPRNALFCGVFHRFSDGDFSTVVPILLNEKLFPSDRLPTSADRCTDYLWQREDEARDWEACSEDQKTHQAVDFLIAAKIILNL